MRADRKGVRRLERQRRSLRPFDDRVNARRGPDECIRSDPCVGLPSMRNKWEAKIAQLGRPGPARTQG